METTLFVSAKTSKDCKYQRYDCGCLNISPFLVTPLVKHSIAIEANSKHAITFKSHYEKAIAQQPTLSANAANKMANQANAASMNTSQNLKVSCTITVISSVNSC